MESGDLLDWLREKLANAEKDLRARESMADCWRSGSTGMWRTVGCRLPRAQRLAEADTQDRIAAKCRRDVEMFKALIEQLSAGTRPTVT